ncbi:MAG: hypothetical protein NTZ83_03070 [Candidatus Pacearchaeota archaeon]|nr:hypothetical protein [Candidatus Pacearchaeota archaeon]
MAMDNNKEKALIFDKHKKSVFVRTSNGNFYFCNIISVDDDFLIVESFAGKRKGERDNLLWLDITEISEYRDLEANV